MTMIASRISWCSGTLNAWRGCTPVSSGCDHCYAKTMVERFGKNFADVELHMERLTDIAKMRAHTDPAGNTRPYLCFVNSMSDFFHEAIPDFVIHAALDRFDETPAVVFQILTKRPIRMRNLIAARYRGWKIPANLWLGVSVEGASVAPRLNALRWLRHRMGDFTAFASCEPLLEDFDGADFTGIDWVISGGESGPKARVMNAMHLATCHSLAREAGAAIFHKQHGQRWSHPDLWRANPRWEIARRFDWLIREGWEHLPEEKGGATIGGLTLREMPPNYHRRCITKET